MKTYQGKDSVAGRLAAKVAKDLLNGEDVVVVNAGGIILSGRKETHEEKMKARRNLKDKRNPQNAEKFPRVPYMIFKKVVSGMLPKKSQRGRDALKKLKVFNNMPSSVDEKSVINEPSVQKKGFLKSTTLAKICNAFGYRE